MKSGDDPVPGTQPQPSKEFILGFKSLTDFSNEGLRRITEATRAFQTLPPPGPLWDLQKSLPEFSRAMRNSRTRIMPIMKTLLEHQQISTTDFKRRDMEEKLDFIVDANDDVLERVGRALDEADGLFNRKEMVVVNKGATLAAKRPPGTWGKKTFGKDQSGGDFRDTTADISRKSAIITLNVGDVGERKIKKAIHRYRVTEKPQLKFATPVDNSLSPFVPKLKFKPNSIKPLSVLPEYTATNEEFYGHPYDLELGKWQPEESLLRKVDPLQPRLLEETPLLLVSTTEELNQMMKELEVVTEMAVDLEHHSYRSFLGLTCLIQISTREKDYIIDALALRDDLEILNDVFTRPKIIKVFHGASSDIEWLQRDFGVYVVGLFDTYLAMKQLSFQQFSLQALLAHYCGLILDKKFQLADWRIRPLPADMLEYARRDTHFLLYAYDMLKNELIEAGNELNNLLTSVFSQSQVIAVRRYEKPGNNPQLALRKTRRNLNNRQVHAFTELYKWRDAKGREKDESLGFVLPNHMLLSIAETLPKEMTGILACCEPVPQLVHLHLGEIHRFVLQARDLPLHEEKLLERNVEKRKKMKNWMLMMNSIHDADVAEGEEDMSLDPKHTRSDDGSIRSGGQTWPEVYKEPAGWKNLKVSNTPVMPFGRPRTVGREIATEVSSPFRRYQMSNEILEKLKKPEAERNLDMADPLVRVVSETIAPEPTTDKPLSTSNTSQVYVPAKVLDNTDFVAFNPMAHAASKPQPKKRNRRQSPSGHGHEHYPADTQDPNEPQVSDMIDDFANGEGEDDDEEMEMFGAPAVDPFVSLPKPKKSQKNRKKSKFLNKVKDFAMGRNKRKRKDGEEEEEPSAKVPRAEAGTPDSNKGRGWGKRGRGGSFDRSRGRGHGRSPAGGESRDGGDHGGMGGREGEEGRRGGKNRGRGGTGFMNPFRRKEAEGRSITFK